MRRVAGGRQGESLATRMGRAIALTVIGLWCWWRFCFYVCVVLDDG